MKRALSQTQAAELLRAASLLPLASRDQFISEVDRRLVRISRRLTDADVSVAIASTLSSHVMCDAQPKGAAHG